MANVNEQHYDFSAGVNQASSKLLMAENELSYAENAEFDQVGSIFKVRGYSQRGEDVNTGYEILGLCSGYKSDGTMKQFAVADGASNSDVYTFNPINGVWSIHNQNLTTGAKAEFEYFLDGAFMVNFSDATRFNNYTAWSTSTNVTNAPKAKYIKLYLSRLYAAYVVDDGTTRTSRVIYSNLPDTSTSPATLSWNNAENYFDVDQDDGDTIKGLGVNANRLLIFKEKKLFRYDTNTLYEVPGCPGTVNNRSIQNLQGHTLYFAPSGIWDYNGTSSALISRKIKDIIEGVSTRSFEEICAYAIGDHYLLYLGDINNTKTGLTIANCLVDYDIAKNAYSWRSLGTDPTCFTTYRDDRSNTTYDEATLKYNESGTAYNGLVSSEERVFFGTLTGEVFQLNTGMTYDGADIPVRIETKDYYLGYPALFKLLQKVYVFTDHASGSVVISYKLDEGDWQTLGVIAKPQQELIFPAASRCQRIKFRISESAQADRFAFEGFDLYFYPEGTLL
jgi:hypothetical protein